MSRAKRTLSFVATSLSLFVVGSSSSAIVGIEAESFVSEGGAGFDIVEDANALGGKYITTATDAGGESPANTATYNVTFTAPSVAPTDGYYIYIRLSVPGPNQAQNDSFFLPSAVGTTQPFDTTDWEKVNSVNNTAPDTTSFYWLNVTEHTDNDNLAKYSVSTAGTYTFTFGGREDGLKVDAFVFSTELDESDSTLNAAVAVPEPACLALIGTGLALIMTRRRGA